MINDPKEVVEDLELENLSFGHLEKSFKSLMSKLQFTLPDRLYIPISNFVISNYIASEITVREQDVLILFDPRSSGLMSQRVQSYLSDIQHPVLGKDS